VEICAMGHYGTCSVGAQTLVACCADIDRDGYALVGAAMQMACAWPVATTSRAPTGLQSMDCDDTSASVNPGAPEVCNGADDNCNGTIDEGATTAYFADCDGDGHGAGSAVNAWYAFSPQAA